MEDDVFAIAYADAKDVLGHELEAVKELEAKAVQLMTLATGFFAALLTGAGLVAGSADLLAALRLQDGARWLLGLTGLAALGFLGTLACALAAYLRKEVSVGLRHADFRTVVDVTMDPSD